MHLILALLLLLPDTVDKSIDDLQWLSGCWSYIDADPGSGEYWMPPGGGMMLAVSRIVSDGETRGFELLRIVEEDGTLALYAQPGGMPATRFQLVELHEWSVTFENQQHDFPNRITYRRDGTRLLGRIEGLINGESRSVDFPMQQTSCEKT